MEHSARRRPRACPHLAYDGASVLNSLISRFPSVVLKNQNPARLAAKWTSCGGLLARLLGTLMKSSSLCGARNSRPAVVRSRVWAKTAMPGGVMLEMPWIFYWRGGWSPGAMPTRGPRRCSTGSRGARSTFSAQSRRRCRQPCSRRVGKRGVRLHHLHRREMGLA